MNDAKLERAQTCPQCGASSADYGRRPEMLAAAQMLESASDELLGAVDAVLAVERRMDGAARALLEEKRAAYLKQRVIYREAVA